MAGCRSASDPLQTRLGQRSNPIIHFSYKLMFNYCIAVWFHTIIICYKVVCRARPIFNFAAKCALSRDPGSLRSHFFLPSPPFSMIFLAIYLPFTYLYLYFSLFEILLEKCSRFHKTVNMSSREKAIFYVTLQMKSFTTKQIILKKWCDYSIKPV